MTRLPRRAMLAVPVLLATASAQAQAPSDAALEALMRAFAAIRTSRATFTEEKALPELNLPLPSTGTLLWVAPSRLEKRTLDPIPENLIVEGDRLVYERPAQNFRREFGLDQSPEFRPLVESIRATLAGDLATLRQHYELAFTGEPAGEWTLRLTPRALRVLAAVQRITLQGRGATILDVVTQGNGTSHMRIVPAS